MSYSGFLGFIIKGSAGIGDQTYYKQKVNAREISCKENPSRTGFQEETCGMRTDELATFSGGNIKTCS